MCGLATIKKVDTARSDLIRAQSLIGLGESDDGLALLAGSTLAADPAAQDLAARTLMDANRLAEAEKVIDAMLAANDASPVAHVRKGQLLEAQGDFSKAIEAYNWFNTGPTPYLQKWQTDASQFDNADDIVAFATGIHRWATLTSAYKDVQQLNDTVLEMFTRAYDVVDRENIPAAVAAVEFAISRGDGGLAEKLIQELNRLAPLNRDVLRLELEAAGGAGDVTALQQTVDRMRYVDPDSFDADAGEVLALVISRRVAAGDRAARLYGRHPDRLEAIGLHAACGFRQRRRF